jgi:hypothetical protein
VGLAYLALVALTGAVLLWLSRPPLPPLPPQQVLFIEVVGASWAALGPQIEAGALPALGRLVAEGAVETALEPLGGEDRLSRSAALRAGRTAEGAVAGPSLWAVARAAGLTAEELAARELAGTGIPAVDVPTPQLLGLRLDPAAGEGWPALDTALGGWLLRPPADTTLVLVGDAGPAAPGLLILWGPGVKPGHLEGLEAQDVAPTIAWLLGLPVAIDLPGRVVDDAFRDEFADRRGLSLVPSYLAR